MAFSGIRSSTGRPELSSQPAFPGRTKPPPSPFGVGSPRGVTNDPNVNAFGTPFGGQSGGVTSPPPTPQSSFSGPIRTPDQRNAAGFGNVGGRMINGVWFPFSPAGGQQQSPVVQQAGNDQSQVAQGGPTNIQTSIEPSDVFSQNQTQLAVNQATADSIIPIDFAMKQFIRPGSSRSNSTLAAALPTFASGLSNAAAAQAQIPFSDRIANLNNQRIGEVGRENEFLALGNLGARFAEQDQFSQLSALQSAFGLASGLI